MAEKGSGRAKRLRCAIYTRKSSDEGLEQEFNSLHAQREACEALSFPKIPSGLGSHRKAESSHH